jgi:ferrous iron transport protein B
VQFLELGIPLIIALNMVDVAEARGIQVDAELLAKLFGAPVVPMVARSNKGIQSLLDRVVEVAGEESKWKPAVLSYGLDIDQSLDQIEAIIRTSEIYDKKYPARWRALKCLEGDSQILTLLKRDPAREDRILDICRVTAKHILDTLEEEPEGIIADHRYGYIAGITKKAVKRRIEARLNLSDKVDKVLTSRILGPLLMLLILYGIYQIIFWASEAPLSWFDAFFDALKSWVAALLPKGDLQSMLVSGVVDGVGGVLGFVPLIMFMFFAIAILEDSGYMARVAYMLDRVMRWFGLHGNSVMALIISGGISGGCAVPGVMATRTLRDPR